MQPDHFCLPTSVPDADVPRDEYMRRLVDFLVSGEDLGFDAAWANEHHFHPYGGLLPSPPISAEITPLRSSRHLRRSR